MWLTIRRHVLPVVIFTALIFFHGTSPRASTVHIDPSSGTATAISGLVVGPTTYDIDFAVGSYDAVFGGALFPNAFSIVESASTALNMVGSPFLIVDGGFRTNFLIPSETATIGSVFVNSSEAVWTNTFGWFGIPSEGLIRTTSDIGVWAVPSVSPVSPIPLPAALPLFMGAMALLGLLGWRRKRLASV